MEQQQQSSSPLEDKNVVGLLCVRLLPPAWLFIVSKNLTEQNFVSRIVPDPLSSLV